MKTLFITNTRIGDAILSTGLLRHLLETESPEITLATSPLAAPLFLGLPHLKEIIAFEKQPYKGHWRKLWQACRGQRWDAIIDLRASGIAYLLRAKRRYHRLPAGAKQLPRVLRNAALMGLNPPPAPTLWLRPEDQTFAEAQIPDDNRPTIAIAPIANWAPKTWPIESFIALAKQLTAPEGLFPHARILVAAAPHEREQALPLLEAFSPDVVDLVNETHLLKVAACFQRCQLFIGNDSGLMHMAAAMETPTVGLFGPTRDDWYAPFGNHCIVVRTPESFEALQQDPRLETQPLPSLMESLSVDTVLEAITALCETNA